MKPLTLSGNLVRMRPFEPADIDAVYALARDKAIADNTFVPHPYALADAEAFVERTRDWWRNDEAYVFAVVEPESGALAGAMGLHPKPEPEHKSAEVGYWIGLPYQGRGYATAALRMLIQFGFDTLGLNRIEAGHFDHNLASGRVMRKAGMLPEGLRREAVLHRDGFKNLAWHAILRGDRRPQRKKTAED